jgi:hypothetical protein
MRMFLRVLEATARQPSSAMGRKVGDSVKL